MAEMTFSESCEEMAKVIQANEHDFIETYSLMLATFIQAHEANETPRMALALAKNAPEDAGRETIDNNGQPAP